MSRTRGSKNRPRSGVGTISAAEQREREQKPWSPSRATFRNGVWRRDPADALTGRPIDLSKDEPTIRVRYWDDTRNDEAPLVATEYVPLKPTVQRIDRGDHRPDVTLNRAGEEVLCQDREGGKAWSHGMEEFMRGVLPHEVAAERKDRLAWWKNRYIEGRMRRHLGDDAVNAMLAFEHGTASLDEIAKAHHRDRAWLMAQFAQVRRLLPHYYPEAERRREGLPHAAARKRVAVPIYPLPPEEPSAEPAVQE